MDEQNNTVLYGLPAFQGESLTSYMIRLANAYVVNIGDLISGCIAPTLNKNYLLNAKYG